MYINQEIGTLADEIWLSTEKTLIESNRINFKTLQVNIDLLFELINVFSYCILTHLINKLSSNSVELTFFQFTENIFIQLLVLDN